MSLEMPPSRKKQARGLTLDKKEAGQVLTTAQAEIIKLRLETIHAMEKMLSGVDLTDIDEWIVQIVDGQVTHMMTPHCLPSVAYALTLMFLALLDMAVQVGPPGMEEKIKRVVDEAYRDHVGVVIDKSGAIPEEIWTGLLAKAAINDL